jgi:hypothetical protein
MDETVKRSFMDEHWILLAPKRRHELFSQ